MVSLEILIFSSMVFLIVGGFLGALISRSVLPPDKKRDLEQRLQVSRSEFDRYQDEVTQHFAETSKLIHNLTHSYKAVHEHLAKGAMQLTSAEIAREITEAGDAKSEHDALSTIDEHGVQAPRDWAPKIPGQSGTLSEEFGLKDEREPDNIESLTARPGAISHGKK